VLRTGSERLLISHAHEMQIPHLPPLEIRQHAPPTLPNLS